MLAQNGQPPGDAAIATLGKYRLNMSRPLGEGSFSVCYPGVHIETNCRVAIKVYKHARGVFARFRRQVTALQELRELPPQLDSNAKELEASDELFVRLIDFSRAADGTPGPDLNAGSSLYIVTEMGEASLRDCLVTFREQGRVPSRGFVLKAARAIVRAAAGLHARGLVHLDLKPDNLMFFNGRLKLIDVDGCQRIGTALSLSDPSLTFSPVYLSPEFARFLVDPTAQPVVAEAGMDVWAVGATLCELVTLSPLMRDQYVGLQRQAASQEEGAGKFNTWLGGLQKAAVPEAVAEFDPKLYELISEMLVADTARRQTLSQCLSHSYLVEHADSEKASAPSLHLELPECVAEIFFDCDVAIFFDGEMPHFHSAREEALTSSSEGGEEELCSI